MVLIPNVNWFKRRIFIGCCLLGLMILLNPSTYGMSKTYVINSDDSESARNCNYYLYVPVSTAAGNYVCRNSPNYINTSGNLTVKPYPVWVKYVYSLGYNPHDGIDNRASLAISSCNSQGNILATTTKSLNMGETVTDYVMVNPNQGLLFNFFTGQWYLRTRLGRHEKRTHTGSVQVTVQFDEAAPNIPEAPAVTSGSGKILTVDGKIYTNNDDVVVSWPRVADNKTNFEGHAVGADWASQYVVNINGKDVALTDDPKLSLSSVNCNGEGIYEIKVKARDYEANESEYGQLVTVVIDRSVAVPELITLTSNYIKKTASVGWSKIIDEVGNVTGSGIKGYQAVLLESESAPSLDYSLEQDLQIELDKTFSDVSSKKYYHIWIRAIDELGNASPWAVKKFSPLPPPATIITSHSSTMVVDNQAYYSINLKVSDVEAHRYYIMRQEANKPSTLKVVDEVEYDVMRKRSFLTADIELTKHTKYQYFVYTKNNLGELSTQPLLTKEITTPNLEPICTIKKGLRPLEVKTELKFVLGPMKDIEGDQLTYRLYLRGPGGGSGSPVQDWAPERDEQEVSYVFEDKTKYEWRISCVETDRSIESKEVFTEGRWESLSVDTDGLIPIIRNQIGLLDEINQPAKRQPLTFQVEYNPKKTFSNYCWDFGDGDKAYDATPEHKYTSIKQYTLTVSAVDELGIQRTVTSTLPVENTHQGELYDNEEWSGKHGVYGNIVVPPGITLKISPGAFVSVNDNVGIEVRGELIAEDPSKGILINHASWTGSWKEIRFEGNGKGTLTGITISNAQTGLIAAGSGNISLTNVLLESNDIGLRYFSGEVTAISSFFKSNKQYGIKNESDLATPILMDCVFIDNQRYHYVDAASIPVSLDDLNQLPSSGNVFQ